MRKVLLTLLILAAVSPCLAYSGGSGTTGDPYKIANVADFNQLSSTPPHWNKAFILTADINLTGLIYTQAPIAPDTSTSSGFQGTQFTGVFDGNNHTISNLTITASTKDYIGLFGYVDSGGQIRNLGVEDVNITGGGDVGGLVGYSIGGNIINNCYSTGAVTGKLHIGGLVGDNYGTIISNCYSTGAVTGKLHIGGLVGRNVGTISNCNSTGSVSGTSNSDRVGGLVGWNYGGNISNCYSTGMVSGIDYVGGLVGWNSFAFFVGGNISKCYSTGVVSGTSNVGGLVGYRENGTISGCYFLDIAGPNNGYGTPLADAQMKQQSSFVGWDFVWETANGPNDIWAICEGVSYPKLAWQFIAGDSDNDKDVDFADFAVLGNKWMQADSNLYCGGSDLTGDGWVDLEDLAVFANNWLL